MKRRWYSLGLSALLSVSMTVTSFAGWTQDGAKWMYEAEQAGQVKDAWHQVGQNWFRFDKDGIMQTGWFQDKDNRRYYLNEEKGAEEGVMRTGWFQDKDGKWYWLNPVSDGTRGSVQYGWHWIDEKCYYLQADGSCLMNGVTPDGYTVDASGAWTVNGVVQIKKAAVKTSGGGSGGSSGGSYVPPVAEHNVYVGDTTRPDGWTQDSDTGLYQVTPGAYTNVIITEAVGDGEVLLDGVIISKNLMVQGGGSNSIKLKGTTTVSGTLVVDKTLASDGKNAPRIELSDTVTIGKVEAKKKAILESVSTLASFGEVTAGDDVTIQGAATKVGTLVSGGKNIHVSDATITTLNASSGTTLSGTGGAKIGQMNVSGKTDIQNLAVDSIQVQQESALKVTGDTSIGEIRADAELKLSSDENSFVSISNVTANRNLELDKITLERVTVEQAGVTISTTAGSSGAVSNMVANSSVILNTNVGTLTAGKADIEIKVDENASVNVIETEQNISITGTGAVDMVAASNEANVDGDYSNAVTEVKFIEKFEQIEDTVDYGDELPILEKEYMVDEAKNKTAKISWPAYSFTSKQPGTYTVYGTWEELPEGYRAGSVRPVAKITISDPTTYSITFKETTGITSMEISWTSTDGGEVFSYANGTVVLLEGKNYNYTISKDGYKPVTGTLTADDNKSIEVTLVKAELSHALTFSVDEGIKTYLTGQVPDSKDYKEGTRIVLPMAHNRTGYQLTWKDGNGNIVTDIIVDGSGIYTAYMTAIEYSITYAGAQEDFPGKTSYTVADSDYALPTPTTADGSTFAGWYTNASFGGNQVEKIAGGSTGNRTFYAKWLKDLPVVGGVAVTKDVIAGKSLDNVYFADGKPVSISASGRMDKELLVTVGGVQYLAEENLNVFAGSYAKDEDKTATGGSVTIHSGKVANVFGGGAGTSTAWSGNTATATGQSSIVINGGEIGRIYGGGSGLATVENVKITINKTDENKPVNSIYGGGSAPLGSLSNLDENDHSANHVGKAEIHVAEGVVTNSLTGGGISIASVDETFIELNGTVKNRMIGAGTNGYVGKVSVTLGATSVLEAGNAYPGSPEYEGACIFQTGFRGIIGDVDILAEDGARIEGDIYLGTNSLYEKGTNQNASITGTMNVVFEADPIVVDGNDEPAGIIYLGVGSNGDSLDNAGAITISGPIKLSEYAYSQKFVTGNSGKPKTDLISDEVRGKVTLAKGACWDKGFAGGNGTEEDPYLISNAAELENIAKIANAADAEPAHYKLINEIDFNDISDEAKNRGYVLKHFSGTLDGDGKTFLANPTKDIAFIHTSYGAELKNLNVVQLEHYINLNWYAEKNITYSNVDVSNEEGTIFITNGQNESSYFSIVTKKGVTVTFEGCDTSASYEIIPGLWGGVFVGGYGQTDTKYVFKNCTNSGDVTGKHVALFIGNSHQAVPANLITVENCANNGKLYGTVSAQLFGHTAAYNAANEAHKGNVTGIDEIKVHDISDVTVKMVKKVTESDATPINVLEIEENEGEKNYTYKFHLFAQYSYENEETEEKGTSLVTLVLDAAPGPNEEANVGWILGSDEAIKYGIIESLEDAVWDTTTINMVEHEYARVVDEKGYVYYIFNSENLAGTKAPLKAKGNFAVNIYKDGLLIGSKEIQLDSLNYAYPNLTVKANLELPVEAVKTTEGEEVPETEDPVIIPDDAVEEESKKEENVEEETTEPETANPTEPEATESETTEPTEPTEPESEPEESEASVEGEA